MSKIFKTGYWAFCFSLFFIGSPLFAANAKTDDAEAEESVVNEVRWYQVELLVFKQRPISTEIPEIWPKNIILFYPDNWDTLKTADEYLSLYQKKPVINTPFILLDKKYFQLSAIEKKLQINRNDILFHGVWRQSLTQNLDQKTDTGTVSLLIHGGEIFDDHNELEGSISLSLQRYLHITTNLWLTHFVPAMPPATETNKPAEVAAVENWPALPTFPLQKMIATDVNNPVVIEKKYQVDEIITNKQSRRMRSYETHYIDHPRFGILVRFIPLDTNTLLPIPPAK